MTFAEDFWQLADKVNRIAITSHKSADDDAIASVLTMFWIVNERYPEKRIEMILSGMPDTERYKSFVNFSAITFVDDCFTLMNDYELAIFVDASRLDRFGVAVEKFSEFKGKTVCIDHHRTEADKFDLEFINPEAGSCTELVYGQLAPDNIEKVELARVVLLGIIGDTDGFKYLSPNQLETISVGKEMLKLIGKSMQDFMAEYAIISEKIFKLVSILINNTEFHPPVNGWPSWQSSGIDRRDVDVGGYTEIEVSHAQHLYMDNYLRWINNYQWGVVFTPKSEAKYNLSLRSLGTGVNVRKIMERMQVGGGHDLAAGGTYELHGNGEDELGQSKARFQKWLEENTPE